MSYRIIGDSCTDLTPELRNHPNVKIAPLSILLGDEVVIDDETFDQKEFIRKMKAYPGCPKSACPTPQAYMDLFQGVDEVYVVTLSSELSGSYNSAEAAKKLYQETNPKAKIAIFNSKSASVGQVLIVMKIMEYLKDGFIFDKIVEKVNEYRDGLGTKFVLESLENLRKNGRLSSMKAILINALNIKPIMTSTKDGKIDKYSQARGFDKALVKMAELIAEEVKNAKDRILGIAHCNNYEKALLFKEKILKLVSFQDVVVVDTAGISSLYANEGGIIVCY